VTAEITITKLYLYLENINQEMERKSRKKSWYGQIVREWARIEGNPREK